MLIILKKNIYFSKKSRIKKSYEEAKCSKNSTLKEPLLSEIDEKNDFILDRLPISNLHLTASIVNLIFEILVQKWGQNQGFAWLEKNHIQNEEYRYNNIFQIPHHSRLKKEKGIMSMYLLSLDDYHRA